MYNNDTFFHLTFTGQTGLAFLSVVLGILVVWLFHKISSRFGLPVKVLTAFVLLWGFVWLSPQLYYTYYLFLFDGLPVQNVIHPPPMPHELLPIIMFTGERTLSDHSKGTLFWIMIGISLWSRFYPKRP